MLKKINRLKKKKEFNYIYKKGTVAHSQSFTLHYVRAFKPYVQIGISVSKQVGNSVVRSRVKRIISESCRLNIEKFAVKNYVITAKEVAKEKSSKDIELELLRVLKKNNLLMEQGDSSTTLRMTINRQKDDKNVIPTDQSERSESPKRSDEQNV